MSLFTKSLKSFGPKSTSGTLKYQTKGISQLIRKSSCGWMYPSKRQNYGPRENTIYRCSSPENSAGLKCFTKQCVPKSKSKKFSKRPTKQQNTSNRLKIASLYEKSTYGLKKARSLTHFVENDFRFKAEKSQVKIEESATLLAVIERTREVLEEYNIKMWEKEEQKCALIQQNRRLRRKIHLSKCKSK